MVIIPFHDHEKRSTLLVFVLQDANLERMKEADPVTLHPMSIGGFLPHVLYPEGMSVLIAYEKDIDRVMQLVSEGDLHGVIEYLNRGYTFIPGTDGVAYR